MSTSKLSVISLVLNHPRAFGIALFAAVFLSACGEGGGAGDFESDPDAVALVTPFVGLYDLPDNWSGFPDNEAYLEIQPPDNRGEAVALIHRASSTSNCIEDRTDSGEVLKDPFLDNVVVLDGIFELEDAILNLVGNNLNIDLPRDISDIDNDNDFTESATLLATPLIGIMVADLGEICQ